MFNVSADLFDQDRLQNALARMSDDELTALEDDLDFCNFTGVPSRRVLEVLKDLVDLDSGWKAMLASRTSPVLPSAY
ncbi:MAG: hypothetical protein LJE62_00620 [Silicimonas sp.]|nr:hypothetical protein [Silicimonas sp.]